MVQQQITSPHRRIAFVQSCWHREIVDQCRDSFIAEMKRSGYAEADIACFEVAGAFEIPLHAKLLAQSGQYDAVVTQLKQCPRRDKDGPTTGLKASPLVQTKGPGLRLGMIATGKRL